MTSVPLQPMGVGQVLDTSFRLFRRHWPVFVGIMAGLTVPSALLQVLDVYLNGPANLETRLPNLLPGLLTMLIALIVGPAATLATIRAAEKALASGEMGIRLAYAGVWRLWFPVVVTGFLYSLAVAFGMILLVLPAFLFMVWFSLTFQVLALEGRGYFGALGRSRQLVRGHFWRTLGVIFLSDLIASFLVFAVVMPLAGVSGVLQVEAPQWAPVAYAAAVAVEGIGTALLAPYPLIAMTVLYHDLRARKEGLDLERVAGILSGGPSRPIAPGAPASMQ